MKTWLVECRDRFEPGGMRGLLRRTGLSRRARFAEVSKGTAASPRALPYYQALLDCGQVVWGHIVQANQKAFDAGEVDVPAVVAFGAASVDVVGPDVLQAITASVFALKGQTPAAPELARIARLISDEMGEYYHERLPDPLTDGRPVFFSTFLVHRRHLPTGRLTFPWFPMLVNAARSPLVLILPLRYWSPALVEHWHAADAGIDGGMAAEVAESEVPTPSAAEEEALRRAWGETPLQLTPAAIAQVRQIIADCNLPPATCLRVSSRRRDGEVQRRMEFADNPPDLARGLRIRCDGFDVATDVISARDLMGVVLDYQERTQDSGFIFRET